VPSLRLFEMLPQQPVVTSRLVAERLETTRPTAGKSIDLLVENGVLEETSGKERGRRYRYVEYVELLRVGTDLD
jgi:predicted transcriptional regulator